MSILDGNNTGYTPGKDNVENSVELCTQKCSNSGYWIFAGMTANGCLCANNPPQARTKLDDQLCQAQCPDHADDACDGAGYASTYVSVHRQQIQRQPPVPVWTRNEEWYHEGCHRADLYLGSSTTISTDLDTEAEAEPCVKYCNNRRNDYDLAGLVEDRYYCNNQDNFSRRDLMVPTEQCNIECEGDEDQPCGGGYLDRKRAPIERYITRYGKTPDHVDDS